MHEMQAHGTPSERLQIVANFGGFFGLQRQKRTSFLFSQTPSKPSGWIFFAFWLPRTVAGAAAKAAGFFATPKVPLKAVAAFAAAAISGGLARAEAPSWSFSPAAQMRFGEMREIVFQDSRKNELLSDLNWALNQSVFLSEKIALDWLWCGVGVDAAAGFPKSVSPLEDSDFIRNGLGGGYDTLYSRHDCRLVFALEGAADFHANLRFERAVLRPKLGVFASGVSWAAKNGFYQYPPDYSKETVSGRVISIVQTTVHPIFGCDADFLLGDKVALGFGASFSPFVFVRTEDWHWLRELKFIDDMNEGFFAEFEARLSFRIARGQRLSIECGVKALEAQGSSTSAPIDDSGETTDSPASAGNIGARQQFGWLGVSYAISGGRR